MVESNSRVAQSVSSPFNLFKLGVVFVALVAAVALSNVNRRVIAQTSGPIMLDPLLGVRTVASGFVTPINLAFLGGAGCCTFATPHSIPSSSISA
jgi:hypothetical protein